MESSAERAIEIGVNVFVFIIALTCSLMLMTNVLNMSELASTIIKDNGNSTLMELYGETNERIYSGDEVLAIISEYVSNSNKIKDKIILKINRSGVITNVTEAKLNISEFNTSFNLTYLGIEKDEEFNIEKKVYLFSEVQASAE